MFSSGGVTSATSLSGGAQNVYDLGHASSTIIFNGGIQTILSGGISEDTDIVRVVSNVSVVVALPLAPLLIAQARKIFFRRQYQRYCG